ncbi:MAG: aldehyde dehydrogenase family protein, partial [Actinobacteria bacterium]|nr:aldehyde dehydrogenase family protein [Actinomycetota bacterium]
MATDLELFIAGEWTTGTGGDHYEVRSPVTGEHIYNVPKASPADIDRAVTAARAAASFVAGVWPAMAWAGIGLVSSASSSSASL